MPLVRNENVSWEFKLEDADRVSLDKFHPSYVDAMPRYFTALDRAFTKAKETSEFEFLLTLFRVRGCNNTGIGDAYETTLRAVPCIYEVHNRAEDFEATRHLQLWLYGHIIEASEPYEILANLVGVSLGERFRSYFYPYKVGKIKPDSPGTKIQHIEQSAEKAGIPEVVMPLKEIWDRNLRNAIFHSDYVLHGGEVHIQGRVYTHDEIMTLITRAIVYHESLSGLYKLNIESYKEPEIISVHPKFSRTPGEKGMVIVREGHGAVGIQSAWSKEEIARGHIHWRIGRFSSEESQLLERNPTLALLPRRNEG